MARKKYSDQLIDKKDIDEEIRPIQGSSTDYITPTGVVYKEYEKGKFFKKKSYVNNHNGYLYIGISYPEGNKSRRLHIEVAKAYLDPIPGMDIVGHKDNNKANPVVSNLYYTNTSENTKKAFDDGLAKNAIGYEDSQSKPVYMFDKDMNYLQDFGSIGVASRKTGISESTIARQCRGEIKSTNYRLNTRCGKIFEYQNESNCITFGV